MFLQFSKDSNFLPWINGPIQIAKRLQFSNDHLACKMSSIGSETVINQFLHLSFTKEAALRFNPHITVWKFNNFSSTSILREITFWEIKKISF